MRGKKVRYAKIVSEKGGTLRVVYPEQAFTVTVNSRPAALDAEALFSGIATVPGDVVEIYTKTKGREDLSCSTYASSTKRPRRISA